MSRVSIECLVGGGHPATFIPPGTRKLFRDFLEALGLSGEFKLNVTAPAQGNPKLQATKVRATGISDNAVCVTFQPGNNGTARSGYLMPIGDLTAQAAYDKIVGAASASTTKDAVPQKTVQAATPPTTPPAPAPTPHLPTPGGQLLRLLKAIEGIVFSRGDLKTIVRNEDRDEFLAAYAMELPDGSYALAAEAIVLALKEATHHDGSGTEVALKIGGNIGKAAQATTTLQGLKSAAESAAAESAAEVTRLENKQTQIQEEIARLQESLEQIGRQKTAATTKRDADIGKVRQIESTISAYEETLQDERIQSAARAAQALSELRSFLA